MNKQFHSYHPMFPNNVNKEAEYWKKLGYEVTEERTGITLHRYVELFSPLSTYLDEIEDYYDRFWGILRGALLDDTALPEEIKVLEREEERIQWLHQGIQETLKRRNNGEKTHKRI